MPQSALDRTIRKLVDDKGEDDFDKQVADLIVAEAKEKNNRGVKEIWRDERPRRHTTNTRFLNNVVRGVQSHNRAVLANSNLISESSSKRLQKTNLIDSSLSFGSKSKRNQNEDGKGSKKSHGMRAWSDEPDEASISIRKRTRSSSPDASSDRHQSNQSAEKERRHRRQSEREREREKEKDEYQRRKHKHSRHRDKGDTTREDVEGFDAHSSKMDRYFEEKYDPMLDVRAETREDGNGSIEDDGWDRMLSVLKDKERRRARKEDRKESKKSRRKEEEAPRIGTDLMDTRYTSRGKLREWDKGKKSANS